jgi:hypothetical protein
LFFSSFSFKYATAIGFYILLPYYSFILNLDVKKMNKISKRKLSIFLNIVLICSLLVVYSVTLAEARSPNVPIFGDKAKTTIGYKILFDESKIPIYGISNDSVAYETDDAYSVLANRLIAEGYTIDTLNQTQNVTSAALEGYDLLVLVAPTAFYSVEEVTAIYNWVTSGKSLLLVSDWGSLFGNSTNVIANEFGYAVAKDYIFDVDDYNGFTYWVTYNESNIKTNALTVGVDAIEMYLGDGVISDPLYSMDVITTDFDDTASWSGGGFANNVPVVSAVDNYEGTGGKIVLVTDANLWTKQDTDGDTILNIDEFNNSQLALNIFTWLSPITVTAPIQGVYFSFIAVFVILVTFIRLKTKKR